MIFQKYFSFVDRIYQFCILQFTESNQVKLQSIYSINYSIKMPISDYYILHDNRKNIVHYI